MGRGWPMHIEERGKGAILTIDPLPDTQFQYTIEFQPIEPDAIDFHISFLFKKRLTIGPSKFYASWPCYINAYDDVLILMFRDSSVKFYVVNAGGHFPISAIQNPAWVFEWAGESRLK